MTHFRKKHYLCSVINNNQHRGQRYIHCNKTMTAEEVKNVLSANREEVIRFFNENVKEDRFYNLKWFMTRVLNYATISWARRKNITEKDVEKVLKGVMKENPQIAKGYVSNYQKAVRYYGEKLAYQILNAR